MNIEAETYIAPTGGLNCGFLAYKPSNVQLSTKSYQKYSIWAKIGINPLVRNKENPIHMINCINIPL